MINTVVKFFEELKGAGSAMAFCNQDQVQGCGESSGRGRCISSLLAALTLTSLPVMDAAASPITATQSVTLSGKYLPENPPNTPDPRLDELC